MQRRQVLGDLQGGIRLPQRPAKTDLSFARSQMTDVFEGSLIRVFRRLQELIRQMSMGTSSLALWTADLANLSFSRSRKSYRVGGAGAKVQRFAQVPGTPIFSRIRSEFGESS